MKSKPRFTMCITVVCIESDAGSQSVKKFCDFIRNQHSFKKKKTRKEQSSMPEMLTRASYS